MYLLLLCVCVYHVVLRAFQFQREGWLDAWTSVKQTETEVLKIREQKEQTDIDLQQTAGVLDRKCAEVVKALHDDAKRDEVVQNDPLLRTASPMNSFATFFDTMSQDEYTAGKWQNLLF